jgi:hypothetical protein
MAFQLTWYHEAEKATPHRSYKELSRTHSLTVGREEGADIVLKDRAVSRLHAEIYIDGSGVQIKDAGSSNGIRLDGRKIKQAPWLPGQILAIGPFYFELASQAAPSEIIAPSPPSSQFNSRFHEPAERGRIQLGEVFDRARQNDKGSVRALFSGFLGRSEQVVDCGYLGAIGYVFPEHSFWCVTNSRVCGLVINRGGWMSFNFGFIKSLNRAVFVQPSLILLWIALISWGLFTLMMALSTASATDYLVYVWLGSGFLAKLISFVVFAVVVGIGGILLPWVVRAYYRFVKSGCVFWTRELVPIVIPSDRNSLRDAQRFIAVFTDQRNMLGD